jgi:uroporphyrinogen-III synthase
MATPLIYLLSTAALSAELVEEAAEKGIVLEAESYISTEPVADEALGADIKELGRRRLTAVFTSVNAVDAVKRWMGGAPDWRIFCTSGATRQLVAGRFGADAIVGTADSAEVLAGVVMADEDDRGAKENGAGDREIFFFCGDQRREELPAILRGEGFTVNEWIVYRTLLTPRKTQRAYAGIAFFSPSAVESYFSLNTPADDVTLFAIGRTTAAAIQARCSCPVIIGDRPGKDALVRVMTDHFQANNRSFSNEQ